MTTIAVTIHTTDGQSWTSADEGDRDVLVESMKGLLDNDLTYLAVDTGPNTTVIIPGPAVTAIEIKQVGR